MIFIASHFAQRIDCLKKRFKSHVLIYLWLRAFVADYYFSPYRPKNCIRRRYPILTHQRMCLSKVFGCQLGQNSILPLPLELLTVRRCLSKTLILVLYAARLFCALFASHCCLISDLEIFNFSIFCSIHAQVVKKAGVIIKPIQYEDVSVHERGETQNRNGRKQGKSMDKNRSSKKSTA